jgi:hypothetical protein
MYCLNIHKILCCIYCPTITLKIHTCGLHIKGLSTAGVQFQFGPQAYSPKITRKSGLLLLLLLFLLQQIFWVITIHFDSKLHFHNHVDYVFSECIKLLGLIHSITYSFSSLECLYVLYFTLVRSELEYASVVWNSVVSTDANKLKRTQQKFMSVCFYRFLLHVPYTYTVALEK